MKRVMFAVAVLICGSIAQGETVHLTGREAEAIRLATSDFVAKHYSRSGDLRHYTVEIERQGKNVEIAFLADEPHPLRANEAGTGSGTTYGLHITYIVSLNPPKIVRFHFAR
jgi:hypothetical protein